MPWYLYLSDTDAYTERVLYLRYLQIATRLGCSKLFPSSYARPPF